MISVCLPTRKRPQILERMINSLRETADTNPEIVVYVDDDDEESAIKATDLKLKLIVGPRITMSDYWNKCYEKTSGDIIMQAGDDIIYRTKGWDTMIQKAFDACPDKILLVHGDDIDPWFPNFGTHPSVHRTWIETVGYFVPPYFSSDYSDWWIIEVAKFMGRIKKLDYITEHMHPRASKAPLDSTYMERADRHQRDKPGDLYAELFYERLMDAEKLQTVINQYTSE